VEIREVLREYLRQQHRGEGEAFALTDSTPLLTHGVLDSIAVMQLLMFLEATFEIEFSPRDLDRRRLDTIEQLEDLVRRKLDERSGGGSPPPEGARG
jgi:acyl carrier protein